MEAGLRQNLAEYKTQLAQIEYAIGLDPSNQDLVVLKSQIEEVVKLTTESLLDLRKARLSQHVEDDTVHTLVQEDPPHEIGEGTGPNVPKVRDKDRHDESEVVEAYTLSSSGDVVTTDTWAEGDHCETLYRMIDGTTYWLQCQILNRRRKRKRTGENEEQDEFLVTLVTPREKHTIPCEFFQEGGEDGCKYGALSCLKSHGLWRKRREIRPITKTIKEIRVGDACLARYKADGLWYPALVQDITSLQNMLKTSNSRDYSGDDSRIFRVIFTGYNEEAYVGFSDIAPSPEMINYNKGDRDAEIEAMNESHRNAAENDEDEDDSDSAEEDGISKSHAFKNGKISGVLDPKMRHFARWQAHTKGFGMKILAKFGYKRGDPLGTDKGRERLIHPIIPKFVVPGRSLDFMYDHKQFHRDRLRHIEKNMIEGGKDVKVAIEEDIPTGHERVFGIINAAGKVKDLNIPTRPERSTSTDSTATTQKKGRANEKETRRRLLEVQDQKRECEARLRQFAKSLVRNSAAVGAGTTTGNNIRALHEEARVELQKLIRVERKLNGSLKMKKRRKTAFKF